MIGCTVNSDDPKENMKRDLDIYMVSYNTGDYERMMEMLYPTFFDLLPKEQVLTELAQMKKEYGSMIMPSYDITFILEPVAFTDTLYSIVDFDFDIVCIHTVVDFDIAYFDIANSADIL